MTMTDDYPRIDENGVVLEGRHNIRSAALPKTIVVTPTMRTARNATHDALVAHHKLATSKDPANLTDADAQELLVSAERLSQACEVEESLWTRAEAGADGLIWK